MSRVDELADVEYQRLVVRRVLSGNRTRIAECLSAGGGCARGIAREILIIDEYRRAVRMNEARDGRIETIREERHLHALTRDQITMAVSHLLGLRYGGIGECSMGKLQRFGFQRVAQRCRTGR